jgi:hypothetical protein
MSSPPVLPTSSAGSNRARPWIVVADGQRLRQLRRQRGMSQEALADRADGTISPTPRPPTGAAQFAPPYWSSRSQSAPPGAPKRGSGRSHCAAQAGLTSGGRRSATETAAHAKKAVTFIRPGTSRWRDEPPCRDPPELDWHTDLYPLCAGSERPAVVRRTVRVLDDAKSLTAGVRACRRRSLLGQGRRELTAQRPPESIQGLASRLRTRP